MDQDAKDRFAMNLSFCFNVLLFVLKVIVVVMSGSLSLIASALDSFLDLLSGGILWFTARQVRRADADRDSFPVGKSRMQPLGILVFSCVMGTVGFQVLVEGVRQLVGPSHVHSVRREDAAARDEGHRSQTCASRRHTSFGCDRIRSGGDAARAAVEDRREERAGRKTLPGRLSPRAPVPRAAGSPAWRARSARRATNIAGTKSLLDCSRLPLFQSYEN